MINLLISAQRTKEAVLSAFSSKQLNGTNGGKTSSCLICISGIKRNEAIWSCKSCYDTFHLTCIQRWAKDSIFQQKNLLEEESGQVDLSRGRITQKSNSIKLNWSCPKCRTLYDEKSIPTRYTCYCEKVVDPTFDPWNIPHSCGDVCGKQLMPECGHKCLILCHPGPCPPCPKMVRNDCYCRNSAPATRRCFEKKWSCGKPCGQLLNCNQHKCPEPCHDGECRPCNKTSVQLCKCGRHQKSLDCASPEWQCEEKCGKPLDCGHHICDEICHEAGKCPPCQLSQLRTCPCGKNTYQLECTVATPTCGDTCGKPLGCPGGHVCIERCHRGKCGSCLQMVKKQCRCSQVLGNVKGRWKEVPCTKEFTCETKCKKMRDCRKHACNRKCCIGDCPPCEQPCNKQLSCKNHKCASRCHPSSCYPCNQTKEISCFCGHSRFLVPCGMERVTKPPKCRIKCKEPPNCHHPSRAPHSCHFGTCPPCRQICDKELKCGHKCQANCHDNVKVKVEEDPGKKAATPLELQNHGKPKFEIKALECPPCEVPVPITCLGGHETSDWPCYQAKSSSCGRKCGRSLSCGLHVCERSCHKVKNAPNEISAGSNCRKCELGCARPRPAGCNHPCPRACHSDPCATCVQLIRINCHCGMAQLYVECEKWINPTSDEEKETLGCCKDQCPKLMDCGHRCYLTCHSGKCGDVTNCRKKSKIYCPCKRKKKDVPCKERTEAMKMVCDNECESLKSKNRNNKELSEDAKKRELEEKLAREEAQRFEKMMSEGNYNNPEGTTRTTQHSRKRKNRRRASQDLELSFIQRHKMLLLFLTIGFTTATALGIFFNRY